MTYNKCCRGSSFRPVYMGGGRRGHCGKQEVFGRLNWKKLLLSDLTQIELPGDQMREIWLAKPTTNIRHLQCEARWFGHQDLGRPLSSSRKLDEDSYQQILEDHLNQSAREG